MNNTLSLRLALVWPLVAMGADQLKNTVEVSTPYVSPGEPITVQIKDSPTTAATGELHLLRPGAKTIVLKSTYFPATAQTPGVLTAIVGPDAAEGTYSVQVFLNGKASSPPDKKAGTVTVGPGGIGPVVLDKFKPETSYRTHWFYSSANHRIRTTDFVLHGSGFVVEKPNSNQIWINGIRAIVTWAKPAEGGQPDAGCSQRAAGTKTVPLPHFIYGIVKGAEEIELCNVPVPTDGRIVVAAGFGDIASDTRLLSVYLLDRNEVAFSAGLVALTLGLVPLALLAFGDKNYFIAGREYRLRKLFLDPETDTFSLSKLQFYLWTVAALFAYSYLYISRVYVQQTGGWPDIPENLPGIILIAAGTAVGAQVVSSARGSKGAGAEQPSLADFITSGGVVAPDRLQMFLWTILGVAAFFYAVYQKDPGSLTELPTVPSNLLVMMGISSAGYLGGKVARKPGPVINQIMVDPPDADETIRERNAPAPVMPDLVVALSRGRAQLTPLSATNLDLTTAITALQKAIDATAAAHTATEFNQLIIELGTHRETAESAAAKIAAAFMADTAGVTAADAQAAQAAAAALQDLTADVTMAIAIAASEPMADEESQVLVAREIELRGTNLSPDAMIEIDNADLSFKMLLNSEGKNLPEVISRDDVNPAFAKILRFRIDPGRLATVEKEQLQRWFAKPGEHTFTILNPDGQHAELSFKIPPAVGQKVGTA